MKIVTWYAKLNTFLIKLHTFLIIVTSPTVHGAACARCLSSSRGAWAIFGPAIAAAIDRGADGRHGAMSVSSLFGCCPGVRSLRKDCHDLSKVTLLASRIIRGERSQVLSGGVVVALEQPVLLVFLNTI